MIRSMTGFGQVDHMIGDEPLEIEIRTVNHRHLDLRVRVPRFLAALEAKVKGHIRERLERGRVEVHIGTAGHVSASRELHVDLDLADQYKEAIDTLSGRYDLDSVLSAQDLLGMAGVVSFVEPLRDETQLFEEVLGAVDRALQEVVAMRESEGRVLADELLGRLSVVEGLVRAFEARAGEVVAAVRLRLTRRMEQLELESGVVEPARLHQEIVLATDRLDITEELVRLHSHSAQFRAIIDEGGMAGRRLDFLIQEMARETNTVGSKASDAALSQDVVELKTELERLREQVQNVE